MASMWGGWLAIIGGVVAVIAEFAPGWYGSLIGGVIAAIGGIIALMEK